MPYIKRKENKLIRDAKIREIVSMILLVLMLMVLVIISL
jgi:hypothetical protein